MFRFDGRVAVVTGAGGGLGRAYALAFAARGAKVVINDLGGSVQGDGSSSKAADNVVAEIKQMGGEAVANYDSVEHGDKIIETAIKNFGRVDILINNAGILRDVSLRRMTDKDWDLINTVHIKGVYKCTKAAWPHMDKQNYGRIINISSAAGLFGNFGQVNYSTAKSGILGFTKSCAIEGAKRNIYSNVICPVAASRMTATVASKEVLDEVKPEAVVPVALLMCHEDSGLNSKVVECGGGWFAAIRMERSRGVYIPPKDGAWTDEDIKDKWAKIEDYTDADHPTTAVESTISMMSAKSKL